MNVFLNNWHHWAVRISPRYGIMRVSKKGRGKLSSGKQHSDNVVDGADGEHRPKASTVTDLTRP